MSSEKEHKEKVAKFKEDVKNLHKSRQSRSNAINFDLLLERHNLKTARDETSAKEKSSSKLKQGLLKDLQTNALKTLKTYTEDEDVKVEKFRKGGRVKGIKNTPTNIIAHAGEVIIPNSLPELQKYAIKLINAHNKSKI